MDERHPADQAQRPDRRAQAKARTQQRVLAAARTLFDRDGYATATIRAIAKEAGMSTGAVFANYEDKADLYRAVYGHDPITPEQGRRLLEAQTMGAQQNTPTFLLWIAERLVEVHGENENADFIHSLRARAAAGAACIIDVKLKESSPCNT